MRPYVHAETGWTPRAGSYEEAVLDWYEQVEKAVAGLLRRTRAADLTTPLDRDQRALSRTEG